MPKDKRLYMTFPIDFDEHPKIAPLSDGAFRAFVEMNGYSRRQNLDGRIPARYALNRWGSDRLDELIDTDPERPVLLRESDAFVLRDYAEHQETNESIAHRRETNSVNGAKGGRPPKPNPAGYARETESLTESPSEPKPNQKQSQSQSQSSEIELPDVTHLGSVSQEGDALSARTDEGVLDHLRVQALTTAQQLGIADLAAVRDWLEKSCGYGLNLTQAVDLASAILAKARGEVREPDRYVIGVCRKSPARVFQYAEDLDLGFAA